MSINHISVLIVVLVPKENIAILTARDHKIICLQTLNNTLLLVMSFERIYQFVYF